jgi:hypothetical protein
MLSGFFYALLDADVAYQRGKRYFQENYFKCESYVRINMRKEFIPNLITSEKNV